jgi:hypothetical protein
MNKELIKQKWTAIELDETEYLNNVPQVARLYTVYMFDRNLVTYICSQEKMYFLTPLYINIDFVDGVDEYEQDSIHSDLCGYTGDGDYYNARDIERLIETGEAKFVEYGDLEEDETEDDVREFWQGNCPI